MFWCQEGSSAFSSDKIFLNEYFFDTVEKPKTKTLFYLAYDHLGMTSFPFHLLQLKTLPTNPSLLKWQPRLAQVLVHLLAQNMQ